MQKLINARMEEKIRSVWYAESLLAFPEISRTHATDIEQRFWHACDGTHSPLAELGIQIELL